MIISRSNIASILGTPFSKTFGIVEMEEALTKALPNVKEKFPNLHIVLKTLQKTVENLVKQEKVIQDQTSKVQDLEKKIESAEKTLKKVMTIYEKANEKIVSTISSIPIVEGPPLDLTAAIVSAPLILAVSNAQELIEQLKDQLKSETTKLSNLAVNYKQAVDSVGKQIVKSVEETDAISYNTEVEQYIYT